MPSGDKPLYEKMSTVIHIAMTREESLQLYNILSLRSGISLAPLRNKPCHLSIFISQCVHYLYFIIMTINRIFNND